MRWAMRLADGCCSSRLRKWSGSTSGSICVFWPSHRGPSGMPASETVSVVVPTCGRPDSLRMALESLIAVSHPAECLQVIVVDDSGGDPRIDEVVNTCATAGVAPLIGGERGGGSGGGGNWGAAAR